MYTSYYNLNKKPFQLNTDPSFLWLGEKHREALATLKYGLLDEKGFLLLTGEAGTGKTTLINSLLESLDDDTLVANITDPDIDLMGFFNLIATSFGVSQKFDKKEEFIVFFKDFLNTLCVNNKRALLIIDEAHRLSKKLLEQSRLLSNIELPQKKLISIFLVGQDELNQRLLSDDCQALRQRITLNYQIQPLSESEMRQYIDYRLKVVGNDKELFTRGAISEIYRFSNGCPRLTNLICDHALIAGYVREVKTITADIIRECTHDVSIPGEVPQDSFSILRTQSTKESLPQNKRPPPVKEKNIKKEVKTLIRDMIQGVRRKAGKLSWEEVKETSIISDIHTAATKRPHLFGVFAVSIVVIILVFVFLSQKDPVSRASQPKLAASPPAASNSGGREQAFAATPDPKYPDKSKITKLTSLEQEVIQKNRSGRELEQMRTPPSEVAPAPTPSETARSTKSSNNAHTNASSKPSHPINTQISKIERSSISSDKDQSNASSTPSHPRNIKTANQSENLRPPSLELAREALKKKNFSRAVELLRVALAQESTRDVPHVKALYSRALRGQAGMFMGTDANRAEILLREAVEIEPQNSEAYFDLGKLYTQSKDFPKAIKSYQKAIDLNSRSAKTFFNLGFIYATTQDYTNAEEMFLRAAELKPPFLDKTIFNLAMVQQKQGKKEECVNNLEKALNINPDNHRARKLFERLTGITGELR